MLRVNEVFSSFSVNDADAALRFYGQTLGLSIQKVAGMPNPGILELLPVPGRLILIYSKADHQPATYTVLNLAVADIDEAAADLRQKGVVFEQYDHPAYGTDEQGICRPRGPEPDIAWFKDPAGNLLSIMQQQSAAERNPT